EEFVDDDDEGYGLGWGILRDDEHGLIVSHSGGMPGLETWFEHHVDEDRTMIIFSCREYSDIRAFVSFWDGMIGTARDKEPEPVVSIEDIAVKDPDRSAWEGYCGKYEHPEDDDFVIDEIFLKEGDLYASAVIEGDETVFRLYPLSDNEFGRKGGMIRLTFGDGCLSYEDFTCKKL
ncbi:MAG: hypothetical protein J5744_01240, partial [Oscillospiraceae bacterium]|nr:hypothetical protein [Oscillospiraceae bacterium]